MSESVEMNNGTESQSSNNASDKQNRSVLNICRFFSAGLIVSLILQLISGASSMVLGALVLPITFGFFVALVASPWLQSLKPALFKIIAWIVFIVGALIGLLISALAGFGMQ